MIREKGALHSDSPGTWETLHKCQGRHLSHSKKPTGEALHWALKKLLGWEDLFHNPVLGTLEKEG